MKTTTMLRRLMAEKTVLAIGAQDALSSRVVEMMGFDAVYLSGLAAEAAFLGRPDLALMTMTERLAIATNMARAVKIPVIADVEEGYGNAIHVMDTVQRFEAAGVAGVHLDDEVQPCKCPFLPNIPKTKLISAEEMCGKIRAASKARKDPDFLIVARSDVIGTVSRDEFRREKLIREAIRRSNAYIEAGADAIWTYCTSIEELKLCAREIKAPLLGSVPESPLSYVEPVSIKVFEELGYKIVVSPVGTLFTAAKGMMEGLKAFKQTLDWNCIPDKRIGDSEYFDLVRFQEYEPLYEKLNIP